MYIGGRREAESKVVTEQIAILEKNNSFYFVSDMVSLLGPRSSLNPLVRRIRYRKMYS